MSSIYRTMNRITVQRDQYIASSTRRLYSRSYTAEEIRADRLREEQWEKDHEAWLNAGRRTHRPINPGSLMWVERKTPDRSIRHRKQRDTATVLKGSQGSNHTTRQH